MPGFQRGRGFALVFAVGILALLSILCATLVQLMRCDRALGANFVYQSRAQLAAESGIHYASAQVQGLPAGPIPDALWRTLGLDFSALDVTPWTDKSNLQRRTRMSEWDNAVTLDYATTVIAEDGKLNINDPNTPVSGTGTIFDEGRMTGLFATLAGLVLENESLGKDVAARLFRDPRLGRIAFPNDRFPSLSHVEQALLDAGLDNHQTEQMLDYLTLHSWQDPDTLRPSLNVYGSRVTRQLSGTNAGGSPITRSFTVAGVQDAVSGERLDDLAGLPVESQLAMQGREYTLEPRAPVNLNIAPLALLQALIQPVRGMYLQDGPAENQSSEHYGWWSTGRGEPDAGVHAAGVFVHTVPFSPEQARRLARALYDRIHGTAWNPDISNDWATAWAGGPVDWDDQQSDRDNDGKPDPNPFETWEEFRHFLEAGLIGCHDAPDGTPAFSKGTPAHDIFLGERFALTLSDQPRAYANYVDPHRTLTLPAAMTKDLTRQTQYKQQVVPYIQASILGPWDADGADIWWRRYHARRHIDALLANFNPNSMLNDFHPNANARLEVDKNQLTVYSTEFCFEPTGVWSLESEGAMTAADGRVLAQRRITAAMRLFVPVRITSQAQFLDGLEESSRIFNYFSVPHAAAAHKYTHGYSTAGAGGACMVAYPELLAPARESIIADTDYDGSLLLADLEFDKTLANVRYYASFNGDGFSPFGSDLPPSFDERLPMENGCSWNALQPGPEQLPGNLHPDGVYCEPGRAFAMNALIQATGARFQFWIKPGFHTGVSSRIRKFLSGPSKPGVFGHLQLPAMYYFSNPATQKDSPYFVPLGGAYLGSLNLYESQRQNWAPTRCLAFGYFWELNSGAAYANRDKLLFGRTISNRLVNDYPWKNPTLPADMAAPFLGHAWNHVAVGFKMNSNNILTRKYMHKMFINGVDVDETYARIEGRWPSYPTTYRGNGFFGDGYTECNPVTTYPAGLSAASTFRFGESRPASSALAQGSSPYAADAMFDEIVAFSTDLGIGPNYGNLYEADVMWKAGRYFSGHTIETGAATAPRARYTSPPLRLASRLPGARGPMPLRSVSWTCYRARNNRTYGTDASTQSTDNVRGLAVNPSDTPDPMIAFWNEGLPDASLAAADRHDARRWDPVAVDIQDAAGTWLGDAHGGPSALLTYPGGSDLRDYTREPERYRYDAAAGEFRFRVNLYLADGQTLYESPVIDDLTFFFLLSPELLEWACR